MLVEMNPVRGWFGGGQVCDSGEFVVVYDVEFRAHHACLEIENDGDGAGVTGGVTEIYPSVGTRFPFGCTDGSLVGGVQDEYGATPRVEVSW